MYSFNKQAHHIQRIIFTIVIMISVIVIGYWLEHHITAIEQWLSEMGYWAGAGFVVLFVLLTPFFFSVDVLCIIAGALFTLTDGITYVLIATMVAAALIFYLGRYLAVDKARLIVLKHPKLAAYEQLIEKDGFKGMFLLRLLPFPFALLSYVFSISRVSFFPYWLATIGIFPYNSILVYFGYMAAHITAQLKQGGDYTGPHNVLIVGGILACILIIGLVTLIARKQLQQMRPPESDDF